MASLRDVLNHIGKKVRLERAGRVVGEGLATARGSTAFTEARLAAEAGDILRFVESGAAFRVRSSKAETIHDRVDHYALEIEPA